MMGAHCGRIRRAVSGANFEFVYCNNRRLFTFLPVAQSHIHCIRRRLALRADMRAAAAAGTQTQPSAPAHPWARGWPLMTLASRRQAPQWLASSARCHGRS